MGIQDGGQYLPSTFDKAQSEWKFKPKQSINLYVLNCQYTFSIKKKYYHSTIAYFALLSYFVLIDVFIIVTAPFLFAMQNIYGQGLWK